jgi:hypothetical protein
MKTTTVLLTTLLTLGLVCRSESAPSEPLTIKDPRPIAEAVRRLVEKDGYVITYEDPRYAYAGDIQDITDQVSKPSHDPARARSRVIVPRGGSLSFETPSSNSASDIAAALNKIVASGGDTGAHFVIQRDADAFHVVPSDVRDRDGNWQPVGSILATPITLSPKKRTYSELMHDIAVEASQGAGVTVTPFSSFGGGLHAHGAEPETYSITANEEPASVVLTRALAAVGGKSAFYWLLLYDPGDKKYVLNILPTRRTPPDPIPAAKAPAADASAATVGGTSTHQ